MTRRVFVGLVRQGTTRIPDEFRSYLNEIAIVVEREPTAAQKRAAEVSASDDLFGLYEGTPRTERAYLPYRLPEKITIFQGALERYCGGDRECLRSEVAHTVWHELAHALGIPEERVRELEHERGWTDA